MSAAAVTRSTARDTGHARSRCRSPAAAGARSSCASRGQWAEHPQPYRSRVAFAAAHVVADPRGENVPGAPAAVDWDATLAFRRHLFCYGLGVAEAMDTAQRNMGLDWPAVQELIRRSADAGRGPRRPDRGRRGHRPRAPT